MPLTSPPQAGETSKGLGTLTDSGSGGLHWHCDEGEEGHRLDWLGVVSAVAVLSLAASRRGRGNYRVEQTSKVGFESQFEIVHMYEKRLPQAQYSKGI